MLIKNGRERFSAFFFAFFKSIQYICRVKPYCDMDFDIVELMDYTGLKAHISSLVVNNEENTLMRHLMRKHNKCV